jgi:molybdopterin-guanine dinucleotide biosynthesis protein A
MQPLAPTSMGVHNAVQRRQVAVNTELDVAPKLKWARMEGEPVTGIVLAGGRSERMGRDKAWVELAGRPLVQWVLDALLQTTDLQMIVAREVGKLDTLAVPVIEDRYEVRGPLTGIHAGLKAAETDLCVVVACDLPLVRPELLKLITDLIGLSHAVVPYVGEETLPSLDRTAPTRDAGLQPLLAGYRRACVDPLESLLRQGSFPTPALVSMLEARILKPVEWRRCDPDGRSFVNVNTPEDVDLAANIMAGTDTD